VGWGEEAGALACRAVLGAMLGSAEAEADARAAIDLAARCGDERAGGLGYLALQLALGLGLGSALGSGLASALGSGLGSGSGSGSRSGLGGYRESVEAAAQARLRLAGGDLDAARRCLDVQRGLAAALHGHCTAAVAAGRRALAGLGPGERWLHGYVGVTSALALYRQPGRGTECADAAGEALSALQELGDPIGEASALDLLGWLAADDGRFERSAWLLGAAQARWELAGGRLGGNPVIEGHRARAAAAAARALGPGRCAELHARGAATPIEQIVALAVAGDDALPSVPAPRSAWDDRAALAAGPGAPGQPDPEELTSREREIAALAAGGLSNRDIADRLFISRRTVDAHLNHIYAKLHISSRVQLTIWERDIGPGSRPDELSPANRT
jgi:DNA-binding CsgD family transcriptional regulator